MDEFAPDTIYCNFQIGEPLMRALASHNASGTVVGPEGAVRDAFVVFVSTESDGDDDEEEFSVSTGITGADGSFSCPLRDGTYWMIVFRPGYLPQYFGGVADWQSADTITVSGTDITDLDVTLQRASSDMGPYSVNGVVYSSIDSVFVEMRGVPVYLTDPTTDDIKYAGISIHDGTYEIPNVAEGVYRLIADRPLYEPQGEWDIITPSDGAEHDIYLQRTSAGIEEHAKLPVAVKILGARPNPFNSSTAIDFVVPAAGEVKLEIFDFALDKLFETTQDFPKGEELMFQWDGKNADGEYPANGIYLYRITLPDGAELWGKFAFMQ
ncbi:MAG: hypothetical protein DRO01_07930 [Thermoproteota archaeon]|nr:MAG: hypothetical protein DRO01_07930 [Candidatus Korarchaeota archaeon]